MLLKTTPLFLIKFFGCGRRPSGYRYNLEKCTAFLYFVLMHTGSYSSTLILLIGVKPFSGAHINEDERPVAKFRIQPLMPTQSRKDTRNQRRMKRDNWIPRCSAHLVPDESIVTKLYIIIQFSARLICLLNCRL